MSQDHTFTCERCGETFISTSSDGEALAEARANGFTESQEDMCLVCDDCYQAFTDWMFGMASRKVVPRKTVLQQALFEAGQIDWSGVGIRPIPVGLLPAGPAPWWQRLLCRIQRAL